MVKHIILWTIKPEFSDAEKEKIKANAKRELEALVGKVEGLTELKLNINGLESSNADMMLDSTLVNKDALKGYQTHPDHVAAANNFVRPFTQTRLCLDFEISFLKELTAQTLFPFGRFL
jgi:hypothetical protein